MSYADSKDIRLYYPLSTIQVFRAFPEYGSSVVGKWYKRWIHEFYHHAGLFVNVRRKMYEEYQWILFCNRFDVDPQTYSIDGQIMQDRWERFYDQVGIEQYVNQVDEYLEALEAIHRGIDGFVNDIVSYKDIAEDNLARLDSIRELGFISSDKLNTLWFNNHINNPPEKVRELRHMPYTEYLKTDHWRKVRDAIVMLYSCRCQGNDCNLMDESAYGGDEGMMHVHHLNYDNRGNERYEDLTLLCDRCHKMVHGIAS